MYTPNELQKRFNPYTYLRFNWEMVITLTLKNANTLQV